MIPRALARKLVMRFSGKPGFPKEDAAITALIDGFERYSANEGHARAIADDLEIETQFCPDISNIYRVAMATRPERKVAPCPYCAGTGFVTREMPRRAIPGVETPPTASCVETCSCRTAQAVVDECVSDGLEI